MMWDIRRGSGLFLTLLAIVAQLTLAVALPASSVSLADVTVICQHEGNNDAPVAPAHPPRDCLLCFFCHNAPGSSGLIVAPPLPPVPALMSVALAVVLPPATAPPHRVVLAAHPRGPPLLA
jgi:hypothetical protein